MNCISIKFTHILKIHIKQNTTISTFYRITKWYEWYLQKYWRIQSKKGKILNEFDMIVDMLTNKKLNPIITELFIRGRKLNIPLVFIARSYFAVPKNID